MDSSLLLVPNRLGWRKADDQVAHITLAMRPYYERRREKARQYARDPVVRERAKSRRSERYANDPEFRQRALESARRAYQRSKGDKDAPLPGKNRDKKKLI